MSIDILIKQLNSDDPPLQSRAALFLRLEGDIHSAYSVLPLLIKKARKVDVENGHIDLHSSNFVGEAAKTSPRLIRKVGYSEENDLHRLVLNWVFDLNYCSELNAAAHSVAALGELWLPPESVRTRLIEMVHIHRRPDNKLEHPGTVRALAFRELASRDRETAKKLIDTSARQEFVGFMNYQIEEHRKRHPNNETVRPKYRAEIDWLNNADAG